MQMESITTTHDILYDDSPFEIKAEQELERIEIRSYSKKVKIATLFIKEKLENKSYSLKLEKSNIFVSVTC